MISGVDGALLVGPVFQNHIHDAVTDDRDEGQSVLAAGVPSRARTSATAVAPSDLAQPATEWDSPRIVYLQNSSDPITYWSFDLIWKPARVARQATAVPTSPRTCSGRRS